MQEAQTPHVLRSQYTIKRGSGHQWPLYCAKTRYEIGKLVKLHIHGFAGILQNIIKSPLRLVNQAPGLRLSMLFKNIPRLIPYKSDDNHDCLYAD
jgi:hypothetical protein